MSLRANERLAGAAPLTTAAAISLVAWIVHIVGSSALAGEKCAHPSLIWVLHGLTALTALLCVACALYGVAVWRQAHAAGDRSDRSALGAAPPDARPASVPTAVRFGAALVVAIALANLLLILWEGSYTEFLPACR